MGEKTVQGVLDNHEERLARLEGNYESLKSSQYELQVTVMKEGQATRDLLNKFVDHTLGAKENAQENKHEVTLKVLAIVGGTLTTGGVVYLLVSSLI